jgi:hypothetical protein
MELQTDEIFFIAARSGDQTADERSSKGFVHCNVAVKEKQQKLALKA